MIIVVIQRSRRALSVAMASSEGRTSNCHQTCRLKLHYFNLKI